MNGEEVIRWTVRIALLLYVAAILVRIYRPQSLAVRQAAEALWSAGAVVFLLHVLAAFAWFHGWSHNHAFQNTAAQTKALLGWEFGYGIYFSYLFAVLWIADAVFGWLTISAVGQDNPRALQSGRIMVHAYLLFIAINGAIVFHDGLIRWAGLAALATIVAWATICWSKGWRLREDPHTAASEK